MIRSGALLLFAALGACGAAAPPPVSVPTAAVPPNAGTPAPPTGQGGPAGPRAPAVLAVTVRSACEHDVNVIVGDAPKAGVGATLSIPAHYDHPATFRPGDRVWLMDASGNGVASITIAATTHELAITASCAALTQP